jgi:hypothetical protein
MCKVVYPLMVLLGVLSAQTPEELNFTSNIGELRDISRMLPNYFNAEAGKYLSKRPRLTTLKEVKARGAQVREQMLKNI